jgi:predicted transcriptional regulator
MAFNKAHAKILAGMIPAEQLVAFRFICGKNEAESHATPEVIDDLIALELVRRDTDGKRDLVLLTPKGKKVAEFV